MEELEIVKALSAIAHESRLAVFRLLVQAGPKGMPAGKVAELTGLPLSTLSFHLKELVSANMVNSKQEGREGKPIVATFLAAIRDKSGALRSDVMHTDSTLLYR
ncbi:ArsR/SmtB family transcription factor [Herbaspirillum sp. B65]|uniref:ArsR/SmtB family transcription factor n=1 Tax=Herbaspirillum sp. B65 TaxID=137708 RepID=UPI0009FF5788|nr:helix-turn-helix domain-containing protein [Herbaspirillum sp. B65]